VAYCLSALVVFATLWVVVQLLLRVRVLTFAVLAALLLAALLQPLVRVLSRRMPRGLAAAVSVLLLVTVPGVIGFFIAGRAARQLGDLQQSVTSGLDDLRSLLVSPPVSLAPDRVDEVRDNLVGFVLTAVPSPRAGATLALELLSGLAIMLFVLFFLLKDGPAMWRWLLSRTPGRSRARVDAAGKRAWATLNSYVRGVVLIALIDAVGIGAGLFLLGVPLALSLTVITFLGAFVPVLGATVSGVLAVVVTLVTEGGGDALIVVGVVLAVQQIEGNLLQPLIMGQALHLHPVVILLAVSAGGLLAGVAGAVVAVPLVAVTYRVSDLLAESREPRDSRAATKRDASMRSPAT